jgi:hypothetical protein
VPVHVGRGIPTLVGHEGFECGKITISRCSQPRRQRVLRPLVLSGPLSPSLSQQRVICTCAVRYEGGSRVLHGAFGGIVMSAMHNLLVITQATVARQKEAALRAVQHAGSTLSS